MPAHKKTPMFLRVITNERIVVRVNPSHVASYQIIVNAKIKTKEGTLEADTIHIYFHSGTGLSYSVGVDISREEFAYICATLAEFDYLNEYEFKAKTEHLRQAQMEEWNKISQENEVQTVSGGPIQAIIDPLDPR